MLDSFNSEVHTRLNSLACDADRVKETIYWAYGAGRLSCFQYSCLVKSIKQMQEDLLALEALEKRFNDVV